MTWNDIVLRAKSYQETFFVNVTKFSLFIDVFSINNLQVYIISIEYQFVLNPA